MNGSISLLRTNVALTSNIKLMVDSNYKLYLESYSANKELSDRRFKKFMINSDSFLSYKYAQFYKDLPADQAFEVYNDIKSDAIHSTYDAQLDDMYFSGPRIVEDTRYFEEFQYNTTLKINPAKLPKGFVIFRSDGPGVMELNANNIKDYIGSLKHVKSFDLTEKTELGKLFYKNYVYDDKIPSSPIDINFKEFEFSNWNGYDYRTGGTASKSFLANEFVNNQMTDFEFEKILTEGFRRNEVICSNYINVSYLFNDDVCGTFLKDAQYELETNPLIHKLVTSGYIKPSDYTLVEDVALNRIYYKFNNDVPYNRRWTINRYTGFYIDDVKELFKVSPYKTVNFRLGEGITVVNNVFKDIANQDVRPTINAVSSDYPTYIKIGEEFLPIELNTNGEYVIISNRVINGDLDSFVQNAQLPIKLVFDQGKIYIKTSDDNYYVNDDLKYLLLKNAIILVKIQDDSYSVKMDGTGFYIDTDEYIQCDNLSLYRKKGEQDSRVDSTLVLIKDSPIMFFTFYQLQFTDIADWDYNRVDTKQTAMEYEKHDAINYQRPIITSIDVNSLSLPKDLYFDKGYKLWTIDAYGANIPYAPTYGNSNPFLLPVSSEYGANGDLYVINNNELSPIWHINQSVNKWGLMGSISNSGYKYKINNDADTNGIFNIVPNMYDETVSLSGMTLDWFYSLGKPIDYSYTDSDSLVKYGLNTLGSNLYPTTINRTLNLELYDEDPNATVPTTNSIYGFNHKFIKDNTSGFDYFDYVFSTYVKYKNTGSSLNPVDRIAITNPCDTVNGPSVFFKGFAAFLRWTSMEDPNAPSPYVTRPATDLSGYSFAILLSARKTDDLANNGKAGIDIIINHDHKNILVNIYVLTPQENVFLSSDFKERDVLYTEDTIKYAFKDGSGNITWLDSELTTKHLTLYHFIKTLNSDSNVIDGYSDGLHFNIVDSTRPKYLINKAEPQSDLTGNYVWFEFQDDLQFKEQQWVKFNNNSLLDLADYEKNLQVVEKKGNKKYKFKFATDQTANCTLINNAIASNTPLANLDIFYFTEEQSILPLKFVPIEPDRVRIDKDANFMTPNNTCNVKPTFSIDTYSKVDVGTDGLIPYIYSNDSISRNYYMANDEDYTDYYDRPKIFRFGGNYEPILTPVELFNNTYLYLMKNEMLATGMIDNTDTTLNPVNVSGFGFYSIDMLQIVNVPNTPKLKPGMIVSIADVNKTFNLVVTIDSISDDGLEVKLNYNVRNEMLPSGFMSLATFQSYYTSAYMYGMTPVSTLKMFGHTERNTHFEFGIKDFGVIQDEMVAKVYDVVNPLKTSNTDKKTFNIFPMIDEHGATTVDHNIFKSPWDLKYYHMTIKNTIS